MLGAIFKSLVHIWIWPIQRYVWLSFCGSVAFFASFLYVGNILISKFVIFSNSWLETITSVLGFASIALITWFLFPVIMSVIIGFFLENIVGSVETQFYPSQQEPEKVVNKLSMYANLKFLGLILVLNIAILPTIFIFPFYIGLYYAINGFAFGFEVFNMVASRKIPTHELQLLRKLKRGSIVLIGLIIAMMQTVPVINIFAPMIGVVAMVHLFNTWKLPKNTKLEALS